MTQPEFQGRAVLFDTSFVRAMLTELSAALSDPSWPTGVRALIPAPQLAEMLHQRAIDVTTGSILAKKHTPNFFQPDALLPILTKTTVVPLDREAAQTLADWSARSYGDPKRYEQRKKLLAFSKSSDVWSHTLRSRLPTDDHTTWEMTFQQLFAEGEAAIRQRHFSKEAPTSTDWLMVGLAIHHDAWIATRENPSKAPEFEHVRDRLIGDMATLRATLGMAAA